MKNFCIALAIAFLAVGCAPAPCTPTMTLEDGTVIEGPKDSGESHSGECSNGGAWWEWPQYHAWEQGTLDDRNNISSSTYNFSLSNYQRQESNILRDYEFETTTHSNTETFFDANNFTSEEPRYALVRGPSFRSTDEDCINELKAKKETEGVPSSLEFIRGAQNMTLAEVKKQRKKLMFRGDNWFWPDPSSKCSKSDSDMTLRSKVRSSERPSDFGSNKQCPGKKMFESITSSSWGGALDTTESYSLSRSLHRDFIDLSEYPEELRRCQKQCFVSRNTIVRHKGNILGQIELERANRVFSVKPPYVREGYNSNVDFPGTYMILKNRRCMSPEEYNNNRSEYRHLIEQIDYTTGRICVGEKDEFFLVSEEQRIACVECETKTYSGMCRFPKNEIFIVRKK